MTAKSKLEKRLSYPIHTNRELELMLSGKKPLSVFSYLEGEEFHSGYFADQPFNEYVENGKLVEIRRTIFKHDSNGPASHYVMFALPGEEWRAEAYALLMDQLHNYEWNSSLERLEGTLLGYSQEQNDEHLAKLRDESSKH